jgi:hypothetical protein
MQFQKALQINLLNSPGLTHAQSTHDTIRTLYVEEVIAKTTQNFRGLVPWYQTFENTVLLSYFFKYKFIVLFVKLFGMGES